MQDDFHCAPSEVLSQINARVEAGDLIAIADRKSTRLNSSHSQISYAVFCLKKKTRVLNHSQAGLPEALLTWFGPPASTERTACHASIDHKFTWTGRSHQPTPGHPPQLLLGV